MIITKQFIMDMGVCGESLVWYESIFGTGPHPYFHVYDKVASTPDIDEETRERWIKWSESLQTNPAAIRYDGRFDYGRYRAVGFGLDELCDTEEEALAYVQSAQDKYYTTEISEANPLFTFSQVIQKEGGELIEPIDYELGIKDGYSYYVHCTHESLAHVVRAEDIQTYLEAEIVKCREDDASCWAVMRELKDTDDGFLVWEKVNA